MKNKLTFFLLGLLFGLAFVSLMLSILIKYWPLIITFLIILIFDIIVVCIKLKKEKTSK